MTTPSSRTKKIPVTCDPHGHLERRPLADLTPFQGGFKDLDDARYAKLRASILAEGFMAPVFVWKDFILDGHQRTTVLEREGWDVEGDVPVVEIEADDEAGAARKLLKLTSAYGKPQPEGVFDFMTTHDLDLGDFADVDLPDFDFQRFDAEFFTELPEGKEYGEDAADGLEMKAKFVVVCPQEGASIARAALEALGKRLPEMEFHEDVTV